ncbi:hypothetical protein [Shinella sp. NM-101]|uniref:phage major tropism determinant n=1 Tax=Shinella sp. NM-101 TaxID=2744455 RepID=UPI001F400FBC|nr:hypothetical protein [Shinella sp. NM-101]
MTNTSKPVIVDRPDHAASILFTSGPNEVALRAGTVLRIDGAEHRFASDTPVVLGTMTPGEDYAVTIGKDGRPFAGRVDGYATPLEAGYVAGFHFAPGGCAQARGGGDAVPAVNPFSLWDVDFRFAGPDPRGMALIDMPDGGRFWADIYLLGVDHRQQGTSRCGVRIADGHSLDRLNYHDAAAIMAAHGKRLLTYDEFRVAALGVTEKSAAGKREEDTGLDPARTSRFGLMQATGNRWVWATDGDPDEPRPSIFGGSWVNGVNAGSRFAALGYWPDDSYETLSARGGGDHLQPA